MNPVADTPALFYALFALSAFLIGLSKGGLDQTLASLATPLMALVMPVEEVIGLLLPILMLADLFAVAMHWRHWRTRFVLVLVPGALLGVAVGTAFLTSVSPRTLRTVLGIIVLLFTVYKVLETRLFRSLQYRPRSWHAALAGSMSGFTSTLAHIGGPPVSSYLLMQEVQPRVFVATAALFFMIMNYIKIPFYYVADVFNLQRLGQLIWLLPVLPLGVWVGRWLVVRLPRRAFERIIILILGVTALILIFS